MELHSFIETGNKLEMQKIRHVKVSDEPVYVSRFLYKKSENEAVVDMPSYQGHLVTLSVGESYIVTFYTNKGLYKCQTEVTDRFYEDGLPVAVVKFQSAFEKLQRRQYYRMECLLNMNFRELTGEETEQLLAERKKRTEGLKEEASEPVEFYEGVTLDISGGGVRFNSSYMAAAGKIVQLKIAFGTSEMQKVSELHAKILTSAPIPNRSGLYEHRAEFTRISNDERERIIRYIFLEERNRRKKNS